MKLIAIYLSPNDIADDINLNILKVSDFETNTIYGAIENLYDIDKDTFYYEPASSYEGSGTFNTVDDEGFEFQWAIEAFDIS